jgi:hypothetical protein
MAYISSFFSLRSGIALSPPKAEAPPGTEGTLGGIPFKEDPGCSPSAKAAAWEGGTARESKNEPQEKRNGPLRRNCLRKTRGPASRKQERMCLPPLVKDPCQRRCPGGRIQNRKIYRNRPIDRKRRGSRDRSRKFVGTPRGLRIAMTYNFRSSTNLRLIYLQTCQCLPKGGTG